MEKRSDFEEVQSRQVMRSCMQERAHDELGAKSVVLSLLFQKRK